MFVESKASQLLGMRVVLEDGTTGIKMLRPGVNLVNDKDWEQFAPTDFAKRFMGEEAVLFPIEGTKGKDDFKGLEARVAVGLAKKMTDADVLKAIKRKETRGDVLDAVENRIYELDPRNPRKK